MNRINETFVTKDKTKIDLGIVASYLQNESYWAKSRTIETIKTSIENSICYSLIGKEGFIGFARVITDKCVFAYLCDVFILPEYQNKQYGHLLMDYIMKDEETQVVKFYLSTKTASKFYEDFGFIKDESIANRLMVKM